MRISAAITALLLICATAATAQPIEVVKHEQLLKLIHPESDTVYVINFWATWCKPCVKELPYFEQVNKKYEGEKFKMILVSFDFPEQMQKTLLPFLERNPLNAEVIVFDQPRGHKWIDEISPNWQGSIPATVICHHPKEFWEFYEKEFTFDILNDIIEPLIQKQ